MFISSILPKNILFISIVDPRVTSPLPTWETHSAHFPENILICFLIVDPEEENATPFDPSRDANDTPLGDSAAYLGGGGDQAFAPSLDFFCRCFR